MWIHCADEINVRMVIVSVSGELLGPNYWGIKFQSLAGVIPIISGSARHIVTVREEYCDGLRRLLTNPSAAAKVSDPIESIGCSSLGYYAIYHGFEDRYLRELLSDVYQHIVPAAYFGKGKGSMSLQTSVPLFDKIAWRYPTDGRISMSGTFSRKISVAFVSAFFFHHSVGLLLRGVIKNIDRGRFSVTVITIGQQTVDNVTDEISASADLTLHLSGPVRNMKEQIVKLQLDVVVFGEIGMDPSTYFLAFSRLARRSMVFWGHAVTSGIVDNFSNPDRGGPDYFVSSVLFETNDTVEAQSQYSERLILLNGMTTYFQRPPPPLPCNTWSYDTSECNIESFVQYLMPSVRLRSLLPADLLASDIHTYGCLQTLYKLHPDMDNILLSILLRDPVGLLLFPEGAKKGLTSQVLSRIGIKLSQMYVGEQAPEKVLQRIVFVRPMNELEYITLASLVDVMLDPFPVGGGRSSFEIFSTGQCGSNTFVCLVHMITFDAVL